ncbi:replication protein [Paraburkholderia sp. WP4_3_2]|uniref:replication protein n=1 Tax=Paraburkholderia sp. WP4_3_2 TaxID=2587162 RepID=UPI00160E42C2|nr:replication protein [Paraburkholderia sp. WP4_3_2]MBB3256893.1 phage replication O-like protein O [Paraburkholderia sp. WP4_3_2]
MQLAHVLHLPEHRGPQLQDGYMRVANELQRAITWARLTAYQRCILDVVMWQTYGFNKSVDEISSSQFVTETGLDASDVRRTLNKLVELNILVRGEGRYARSYSINKRHATWMIEEERKLINKPGFSRVNLPAGEGKSPCLEGVNRPVEQGESPPTKDNSKIQDQKTTSKENLSRSLCDRFEIFWKAYPKKRSKEKAEKAFAKRKPDEQLFNDLMAGLERAKTSEQWQNPQFIPHAATWLNNGGWMDEYQTTYTDAELAVIRAFNGALGERVGTVDESVFVEARAGAIRAFLAHLKGDLEAAGRYFPAVRDKVDLPPHAGFDYLVSPKGFGDTTGRMRLAKTPGVPASGGRVDWHATTPGIEAKGAELGVSKREDDNTVWYRRRVFKAAGPGVWRDQDLAAEKKYGDQAYERLWRFYNDEGKSA